MWFNVRPDPELPEKPATDPENIVPDLQNTDCLALGTNLVNLPLFRFSTWLHSVRRRVFRAAGRAGAHDSESVLKTERPWKWAEREGPLQRPLQTVRRLQHYKDGVQPAAHLCLPKSLAGRLENPRK
jgi:hypothetical protein